MQSSETKCLNCRNTETQEKQIPSQAPYNHSENNQINVIYVKCSKCQIIQCKPCFKQHLSENHTNTNTLPNPQSQFLCEIICQECQENDSKKFCQNCEQHLCDKCSFRIHNKGKRAKHNVLSNQMLIRIQKLLFLNQSQTEEFFKLHEKDYDPTNCLIVYGPYRPDFLEDFESLEVQNFNSLTIDEIESCLNRYPMISLFSVNESDRQLTKLLKSMVYQSEYSQEDEKQSVIFLGGFQIELEIRKSHSNKNNMPNDDLPIDSSSNQINQTNSENSLPNQLKISIQKLIPHENKFTKKEEIDFSCGSKEEKEMIPEMQKLFKKSLKMSNRSLIIQIPQTKPYRQSPIKSDRQQGFIQRNLNLLQNAIKNDKSEKTITLHLDEHYNDISESTMNFYEQSDYKSNNQESILLMGAMQEPDRDTSFNLITNDQSCSDFCNSIDQNDNLAATFSLLNAGSISLSTDNSVKKRQKKSPIPYFQPTKSKNIENLNNSYGYMFTEKNRFRLEKKFRELAEAGTLMVSKMQLDQLNLNLDEKIVRKMKKNVCDEEIQYFSLNLQLISIQCICWVLESIKQDRMMPSEKLVLSRLKESFNIKPAHKLWIFIIKYLESSQYFTDKKQYDRQKRLPTIIVGRFNDQTLLEYESKWPYEDQEEPAFSLDEWETFRLFLNDYFKRSKQITGGRYGCVQYVKLNGPQKLRECSLGRLSYFVQEAINKGLIRYHKTLLIQNYQSFEKSIQLETNRMQLFDMQKELKILKIQVTLIDIFLQAGIQTEVSLAQIPLTFKKMILFDVNLLQLGYPKLKNILHTLTDKLVLSSSKSHIKYQQIKSQQKIEELKIKYQQMMQYFINQITEVIASCMSNRHYIIAHQLHNLMNEQLGFVFDFKVCNVPDFYQFLIYYCHQIINLQFINGIFVTFPKHIGYMPYQFMNGHPISPNYQNYHYGHNYGQYGNVHHNYYNHQVEFNNLNQQGTYYPQQGQGCNFMPNNFIPSSQNQAYQYHCPLHPSQLYQTAHQKNPQQQKQRTFQSQIPYPIQNQVFGQASEISTPKFNESIEYINKKTNQYNIKKIQNFKWQSYLDVMSNVEDQQEKNNNFQTQSFTDYRSIYNILDDDNSEAKSKISFPKTFIEKQGSCNHNHGELYISKITPIDEKSDRNQQYDASLRLFDESPDKETHLDLLNQNVKKGRKIKAQHTRVYSTTQARTKHQRMYSTTTAKN